LFLILYSHKCGQLGNRLFAFAHLIANSASQGRKIVNLAFEEYAPYFSTTSEDILCRFPPKKSVIRSTRLRHALYTLNAAVLKMLRIVGFKKSFLHQVIIADLPEYQFNTQNFLQMDTPDFQQAIQQKPLVFLFGRFFRDYRNFTKNQDIIRDYFKPIEAIQTNVNKFLLEARRGAELLVGVHIRRGDYQTYANGKYFYSQVSYSEKMKELAAANPARKIRFVICSNEPVDVACFEEQDFRPGPGHLVEDMYVLAGCDLIFGPPSTFTRWASFYGKVPLYTMGNLETKIDLESFIILEDQHLYNF
jgi:hypothetical protein